MKKNAKLNQWFWKWHFIAGLVSLPFIILISITGIIYLFKAQYEEPIYQSIKEVVVQGDPISYQEQWQIANENAVKKPNVMVLSTTKNSATEFVSGRFGKKISLYVDPYKGEISGQISPKGSFMHVIRKLHGELLLSKFGTKIVELIASWMVVLIITGLYIWWPGRGWKLKGFFIPRVNQGKRTLFRDLHSISGFWISGLLLLTLAGGFPWTDVFGGNFKWVQKVTNTGYPSTWEGGKLQSEAQGSPLPLDNIVTIAKDLNLQGIVSISFPKSEKGVFSVSNQTAELNQQKMYHLDQFTGKQVLKHNWEDVGFLMRGRMWLMAFHQGEFGPWNWWLMLCTGIALVMMSISAIVSYILRKRKGSWSIPKIPSTFKVGYGLLAIMMILGIVFPLFGISLVLLWLYELIKRSRVANSLQTQT